MCTLAFLPFLIAASSATTPPKQKRPSRLYIKTSAGTGKLVLTPKTKGAASDFKLIQKGREISVVFDSALRLQRKPPFAIQINAPAPLEVTPATVVLADWPAQGRELPLTVKNFERGKTYTLTGSAVFFGCNDKNRCASRQNTLELEFTP